MVPTLALQKRRWNDYDSDAEELERMMATVGGGSNPEKGDKAEQEASLSDPTSEIKVLGEAVPRRIPPRSKSLKRRCPQRTPLGLCLQPRSLYSE